MTFAKPLTKVQHSTAKGNHNHTKSQMGTFESHCMPKGMGKRCGLKHGSYIQTHSWLVSGICCLIMEGLNMWTLPSGGRYWVVHPRRQKDLINGGQSGVFQSFSLQQNENGQRLDKVGE